MHVEHSTRVARSLEALDRLLGRIADGEVEKPDWIALQGAASLAQVPVSRLPEWLTRLHACVRRGFRHAPFSGKNPAAYLDRWRCVARHGFHDFIEGAWSKGYDSPFVEDQDYVGPYLDGGLEALDPFDVYSSVLGTWEFSVEDFLATEVCRDVGTIVEPMAGSAEFCYAGHFLRPDLEYVMLDLDPAAAMHAERRRWLPAARRSFVLGDVLTESAWREIESRTRGRSLAYVGKQSQNFFAPDGVMRLLDLGTRHAGALMLEVTAPYLLEAEPSADDLTRVEQRAAGFSVALEDVPGRVSNPLTNRLHLDLVVRDARGARTLFEYRDWTGYQPATLVAFARLLGLTTLYFHNQDAEFVPVEERTETSDCRDENTFLLFHR